MIKTTVILFHGIFLIFVQLVLTIASLQVDEGNYIVPRTTLELSTGTNKSAEGHKKICTSNLDCEMYVNNQCCLTISGYSKCRKTCRRRKKSHKFRLGHKRKSKKINRHKKKHSSPATIGCVVGTKVYKEGHVKPAKDGCNDCICKRGKMICSERPCPPGKCIYKQKTYKNGDRLVLHNGCKRCICQYRSWNCTSHPCVKVVNRNATSLEEIDSKHFKKKRLKKVDRATFCAGWKK